ncbi:hypothetical protein K3N28_00425 [Glycomyces sp. TRM65418]|uniref:hypothetical protein n=1 Tax=Glycomyces sp. TRM65418 TaxID=2867006 RepID=UPI001CE5F415|nr:hypothetical protein [Glycomyces sp. TRM65418]MCC3761543.1 hypothetical protein [Glycomyces sp. TRM65418]QZD55640.1 hypothetical protein K3N28_00420 [Glycomyces sp. TRM65418]
MTDSARTYFDTFMSLAGPARRARHFAGKVREDLRAGTEGLKSGAEQAREHGTRTASDIGRLIRAEFDASLTRIGVATQADLEDLNLRLEHSEEQIRDLRLRLAEAEARAAAEPDDEGLERPAPGAAAEPDEGDLERPAPGAGAEPDGEEPQRPAPGPAGAEPTDDEEPQRPAPGAGATGPNGRE